MATEKLSTYTAFDGPELFAEGPLDEVVLKVKKRANRGGNQIHAGVNGDIIVFNDDTGKTMDFDLRGSDKDVLERLKVFRSEEPSAYSGPGRPKLGVVAREVSLLPRHWEWLATQPGGASAALRRLVDEARKDPSPKEKLRQAQERTYRFMSVLAGDLTGYEEALRALYAKDEKKFKEQMRSWPKDVSHHAKKLARDVF